MATICFHQILQNKFFNTSTPFMTKVDDRENGKNYAGIETINVVASRPPEQGTDWNSDHSGQMFKICKKSGTLVIL